MTVSRPIKVGRSVYSVTKSEKKKRKKPDLLKENNSNNKYLHFIFLAPAILQMAAIEVVSETDVRRYPCNSPD